MAGAIGADTPGMHTELDSKHRHQTGSIHKIPHTGSKPGNNIIHMQRSIVFVDLRIWASPIFSSMQGGGYNVPPQEEPLIRAAEVTVCYLPKQSHDNHRLNMCA